MASDEALSYSEVICGEDNPDMIIMSSSKGPVMLTAEGAWLLDSEGNPVAEIDKRAFLEEVFKRMEK